MERLEHLQVIKTRDSGTVDKATLTRDQITQVENLGWYVSDQDIKRLIQWMEAAWNADLRKGPRYFG